MFRGRRQSHLGTTQKKVLEKERFELALKIGKIALGLAEKEQTIANRRQVVCPEGYR